MVSSGILWLQLTLININRNIKLPRHAEQSNTAAESLKRSSIASCCWCCHKLYLYNEEVEPRVSVECSILWSIMQFMRMYDIRRRRWSLLLCHAYAMFFHNGCQLWYDMYILWTICVCDYMVLWYGISISGSLWYDMYISDNMKMRICTIVYPLSPDHVISHSFTYH